MARIDIGRLTLSYIEKGQGEPLLFIPGLIGMHTSWSLQIEHFSQRFRCISFDHRGAGDSDKPSGGEHYSTVHVAADVIGLLDALGIARVHAIGTSTGGCILQNLALDRPERLLSCVFSNTWTRADVYIRRLQLLRRWIAESHGADAYVEFSSIMTNGPLAFRENLARVMEVEQRSKATIGAVETITARVDMTLTHDRLDELHRIDRPSLIFAARDDSTVPAYFSDDLNRLIAGSRLVMFEHGGHFCYRQRPDDWNAVVEAFLEENRAMA